MTSKCSFLAKMMSRHKNSFVIQWLKCSESLILAALPLILVSYILYYVNFRFDNGQFLYVFAVNLGVILNNFFLQKNSVAGGM